MGIRRLGQKYKCQGGYKEIISLTAKVYITSLNSHSAHNSLGHNIYEGVKEAVATGKKENPPDPSLTHGPMGACCCRLPTRAGLYLNLSLLKQGCIGPLPFEGHHVHVLQSP